MLIIQPVLGKLMYYDKDPLRVFKATQIKLSFFNVIYI